MEFGVWVKETEIWENILLIKRISLPHQPWPLWCQCHPARKAKLSLQVKQRSIASWDSTVSFPVCEMYTSICRQKLLIPVLMACYFTTERWRRREEKNCLAFPMFWVWEQCAAVKSSHYLGHYRNDSLHRSRWAAMPAQTLSTSVFFCPDYISLLTLSKFIHIFYTIPMEAVSAVLYCR